MAAVCRINRLCGTWQGFIQQAVYLISRGYVFHLLMLYPEKKRDRFEDTDRKLITKYGADLSKFQRSRRKLKGLANFYFMRWDQTACVFMTPGKIPEGVHPDGGFRDSREKNGRFRF